jgi:alcohol dehydrogenase class IV
MPSSLREIGVEHNDLQKMAEKTVAHGTVGKFQKLGISDVLAVLQNAY